MPSTTKTQKYRATNRWRHQLHRFIRTGCWLAIIMGLTLGLYLTLRPSGRISEITWLPRSLTYWADYHGQLRNVPAFALLAIPFLLLANGRRARRHAIAGLAVFVAATEIAQYFIPNRWCEWQDIANGWAGLATTWLIFELWFRGAWRIRQAVKYRSSPPKEIVLAPIVQPVRNRNDGA